MRKRSKKKRQKNLLLHERRLARAGYKLIAGVDEVGRGPLAGPVVASACIIKNFSFRAEINDSKKLSPRKREKAYNELAKKSIFGIGIVSEKTIDAINIHQATKRAMEIAISNLGIAPDYVLVDGRMKLTVKCPLECIISGDSKSLSIAAASIIAKVTRDSLMVKYDEEYPQYGFSRHKGYPTKFHKSALKNHGPSPIHRYSFRPVKDLRPSELY